jgi:hypothetical protein
MIGIIGAGGKIGGSADGDGYGRCEVRRGGMGEIQEYGCACLELIHVCSWHEVICWTVLDVSYTEGRYEYL